MQPKDSKSFTDQDFQLFVQLRINKEQEGVDLPGALPDGITAEQVEALYVKIENLKGLLPQIDYAKATPVELIREARYSLVQGNFASLETIARNALHQAESIAKTGRTREVRALAKVLNVLVLAQFDQNKLAEAEEMLAIAISLTCGKDQKPTREIIELKRSLAQKILYEGNCAHAETVAREALPLLELLGKAGPGERAEDLVRAEVLYVLAKAQFAQNKLAEAECTLTEVVRISHLHSGPMRPHETTFRRELLTALLLAQGKFDAVCQLILDEPRSSSSAPDKYTQESLSKYFACLEKVNDAKTVDLDIANNPLYELWQHWNGIVNEGYDNAPEAMKLTIEDYYYSVSAQMRTAASRTFSWAVPTPKALEAISKLGPIIEVCAGTAYWQAIGKVHGHKDWIATDIAPPGQKYNGYHPGYRSWSGSVVKLNAVDAVKQYPGYALLIGWAPYASPVAYEALSAYAESGGKTMVFIGNEKGQATANDDFYDLLEKKNEHGQQEWILQESIELPVFNPFAKRKNSVNIYKKHLLAPALRSATIH